MGLDGALYEAPGIRIASVQFQKSRRNANRMKPGQKTVEDCSSSLMSATCSSSPKQQDVEDRKTMATKYDGVGPHRPGRGISEARPDRLARLYCDYCYAAGHEQKPFACEACNHTMREHYRRHSAGRSTRQHASLNGSLASQTGDETHLTRVRVHCLQKQQHVLLFNATLGYLGFRTLYWPAHNSYRARKLSKAVSARSQANTGSAWRSNNGVACSPVCHNSNIVLGKAMRL
jgi:hypothetical protein